MTSVAIASALCGICGSPLLARGLCRRHYMQVYRTGKVIEVNRERGHWRDKLCRVAECDTEVKSRGLCGRHYEAARKNIIIELCELLGCKGRVHKLGLCEGHYGYYEQKLGNPYAARKRIDRSIVKKNLNILAREKRLQMIKERHRMFLEKRARESREMAYQVISEDPLYENINVLSDSEVDEGFYNYMNDLNGEEG